MDEETHVVLFGNLIKSVISELNLDKKELEKEIHEIVELIVGDEIRWINSITDDKIMGLSNESNTQFTKHLLNKRLQFIGFDNYYLDSPKNHYKHLEKISNLQGTSKSNYFETRVTSYEIGRLSEFDPTDLF